jgi:uncharacterized membrane protein YgaE (UPF0421/DUF939 family)
MLVVAFFIPNPKKTKHKQKDKQWETTVKKIREEKLCTIIKACKR